jgi:hypothetical protein
MDIVGSSHRIASPIYERINKLLIVYAVFEDALATTILLMPYLGRTLLGWQPRMPSLVDGMETYYASYTAIKKL